MSRSHQVNSFPLASIFQTHEPSKNLKLTKRARLKPVSSSLDAGISETASSTFRNKPPSETNVLVVGSTGYIGRFVVKELVKRGFNVIAVARERSGVRGKNNKEETLNQLRGANVCFSDVTELPSFEQSVENLGLGIDVVVSCLASRKGGVKDSDQCC